MGFSEDIELLTALLSRMQGEREPEKTARLLMNQYGSLQSVLECLPAQDDSLPVSQNARMLLTMIPELARMREMERVGKNPVLDTLQAAARYAAALYIGAHYERIYLLCLDARFRLIKCCPLGEGSVREVPFYPRKIMQEALNCNAQSVILCHNHLTDWCFFSEADLSATREFLSLCTLIHLPLLDHLLVAGGQVSSMRSKAHIPESDWLASSPLMPPLGRWRAPSAGSRIEILPASES